MSDQEKPATLPNPLPWLLTVAQAAALLGVGRSTVYELMESRSLPFVNIGSGTERPAYRIVTRVLEAWLAEQCGYKLSAFERQEVYQQMLKGKKEAA